ncbi:hypothetical protein MSP8887_02448 [Marinomonas spartinae]|uniref:hypothetical protein n=1 Tax=Marinomonas spartinae TaxID=1792290 RepID=UPI000808D4AB|nr:hypothetical protein [Marinomonas spartinae]SBS35714.1 hypothetical protein MSP8887_02448 [Marinomonas spartinae]
MINKLKAIYRGFLAGPDFNYVNTYRFILENKLLSILVPNSNVSVVSSAVELHYPYSSKIWFEENKEYLNQHEYVHMLTRMWGYLPLVNLIPDNELGVLTFQLRIKRTEKINVLDREALANYVIQEYDNFYNGPEGQNTIVRQEVEEQSANLVTPFTPEELKEQLKFALANRGYPLLNPAKQIEINNRTWVFYHEWMQNRRSFQDYYCLPLSENCFLEAKFDHRVDRSDKHKKWKKHALQAQERIMQSITLGDIPEEEGRLIEGQVE